MLLWFNPGKRKEGRRGEVRPHCLPKGAETLFQSPDSQVSLFPPRVHIKRCTLCVAADFQTRAINAAGWLVLFVFSAGFLEPRVMRRHTRTTPPLLLPLWCRWHKARVNAATAHRVSHTSPPSLLTCHKASDQSHLKQLRYRHPAANSLAPWRSLAALSSLRFNHGSGIITYNNAHNTTHTQHTHTQCYGS